MADRRRPASARPRSSSRTPRPSRRTAPAASLAVRRRPSRTTGSASPRLRSVGFISSPKRFAYACHSTWLEPISSAPPSTTLPGTKSRNDRTRPPTRLRASTTWTSRPALASSYAAASPEKPAPTTMTRPRPAPLRMAAAAEEQAGTRGEGRQQHLATGQAVAPIGRVAVVQARIEGTHRSGRTPPSGRRSNTRMPRSMPLQMSDVRFAVVGAGAVGGYYAARLAHAGFDVALLARGAHLEAIRARGLWVWSPARRPRRSPARLCGPGRNRAGRRRPVRGQDLRQRHGAAAARRRCSDRTRSSSRCRTACPALRTSAPSSARSGYSPAPPTSPRR